MATHRYGQIWHGDHHPINIRFPSTEARLKFQNEFEAYHASHDHEGDIPTFRSVPSKDLKLGTGSRSPQDLVKAETDKDYNITLDGYSWSEIQEYHNPSGFRDYFWYHVPTCCVPPVIVVDHEFVDSDTLPRHPLSSIFGDMPADDFQSLIDSVQTDGFIDPIVRIHEGQILDGWHRYRAAQELNLIRRLKFQEWNEDEHRDGDPKAFVLARNIERRHLNPSQRAQIVVAFNARFNRGDIHSQRADSPEGEPKTRQELAQEAGVGTRTIDRAIAVERAGQSEDVIAGEKSASEVLKENVSNCKKELRRILEVQGILNNSADDARALSEAYNLTVPRVRNLKDKVWDDAITKAREKWQKSYTQVRAAWMDYEELSKTVEWEIFVAAAIEAEGTLSVETFTEAGRRIKSDDWKLLNLEVLGLSTLAVHLRNPSFWVSNLIPEEFDADKITGTGDFDKDCRKRPSKIRDALPQWQKDVGDHHIPDSVKDAVRSADPTRVVQGAQRMGKVKDINDVSAAEIRAIVRLMERAELTLYFCVHDVQFEFEKMSGADNADENLPLQDALDEMKAEDTYEQKQQEHVNRLEALPGEIRSYFPTWQQEHGIEGNLTLKRLLNARCQIEFGRERGPDPFFKEELEDVLQRMKLNDENFVEKVCELLGESAENIEDEGLAGIDIHALRDALSSLLETLGVSDMHLDLKDTLTGDLLNVFLEYENLPTAKEQVIALLDTADCILSEL